MNDDSDIRMRNKGDIEHFIIDADSVIASLENDGFLANHDRELLGKFMAWRDAQAHGDQATLIDTFLKERDPND